MILVMNIDYVMSARSFVKLLLFVAHTTHTHTPFTTDDVCHRDCGTHKHGVKNAEQIERALIISN